MPWHPGHGPSTRITPNDDEFDKIVDDLCRAPWLSEVSGILSGYLGSSRQAKSIARLVRTVKEKSPDITYLCDPVIGDEGGLYVPEDRAAAIRDELIPLADIASPNRFELAWLTGSNLNSLSDVLSAARLLGPEKILVTSMLSDGPKRTGNLLVQLNGALFAEHDLIDAHINGVGDLTSALFLALALADYDDERCLKLVTSSVCEILLNTKAADSNELLLERNLNSLSGPKFSIDVNSVQ